MSDPAADPRPRREEILDVATRLFAERGYDGASVNDVAEQAGLRKASLFHHFATKEALYEAVLDRLVASLRQPLEAIYAGDGTFEERLDTLTATLVTAFGARPYAARLLLREAMDWGPVIRGAMADRIVLVLEAGAAWVGAGQQQGTFVREDPRQLVLSAIGLHLVPFVIGPLVERFMGKSPFDEEFVAERRAALIAQARRLHLTGR